MARLPQEVIEAALCRIFGHRWRKIYFIDRDAHYFKCAGCGRETK